MVVLQYTSAIRSEVGPEKIDHLTDKTLYPMFLPHFRVRPVSRPVPLSELGTHGADDTYQVRGLQKTFDDKVKSKSQT